MAKKPKLKCRKGVDDCPSFGGTKSSKSMSFTAKKGKKGGPDPIEMEEKGSHMNVRDLGNDSGQVKPALINNKESYTEAQFQRAVASENAFSKLKARKK